MKKIYYIFILLLLLKFLLIYNIPIFDRDLSLRDDYFMVNIAKNLIEGKWLGIFDEFTFIKGITYPIFLAINYVLYIPSNIANTILYFISCIIFIKSMQNILKYTWQKIIIFIIMFFSPISYSLITFQRAYRDDIYYSLILILISAYIGIYLRIKENKQVKNWIIIASISFVLSWFCREDTIWIVPFLIFFSIIIYLNRNNRITNKMKLVYLTMPFIMCIFCGLIIGYVNYLVYGVFIINDFQYSSYVKTYSLMTQIKTEKNYNKVTLSREAIQKLYEECPSFLELKPYYNGTGDIYDGDLVKMWLNTSNKWNGKEVPNDEIGASHSMWVFRNAVSEAGYYSSAKKADAYYKRLSSEINKAFEEGRLEKRDGIRIPLFTTMDKSELKNLVYIMGDTFNYVVNYYDTLNGNTIISPKYYTDIKTNNKEIYELILRQKAMPLEGGYIGGWLVSDRENLQAFIENNKGEKIEKIKWLNSDDVSNYFKEKNIIYKEDNNARFSVYFKIRDYEMPYYLSLYENGKNIKKISFMEINGIDNDLKLQWNFDMVNLQENKPTIIEYKVILLQKLAKFYAVLNGVITYISLIIYIMLSIMIFKHKKDIGIEIYNIWIVLSVVLSVFILRIFTIAYNTVTAFNSISYGYLSPCYPLMAVFNALSLILILTYLNNLLRRSK